MLLSWLENLPNCSSEITPFEMWQVNSVVILWLKEFCRHFCTSLFDDLLMCVLSISVWLRVIVFSFLVLALAHGWDHDIFYLVNLF